MVRFTSKEESKIIKPQGFGVTELDRAWLVTSIGLSPGMPVKPHTPVIFPALTKDALVYGILTHRVELKGLHFQPFPEPMKIDKGTVFKAMP